MADLQALYQDPRFQGLSEDKQSNVITGIVGKDPKFQALPDDKKAAVLNGIMSNVRSLSTKEQPKSDHNIIGSVAAAADMVLGFPVVMAQTAIEAGRADVGMFLGEKDAAQKGVAAGRPLDKWTGLVSEQVDKHYGAGTVANSSLGRIFNKVGEKIQQTQEKVAGKDPEKQAAAKITTDILLNVVAPHLVVGAGKAIKGLGKAKVADAVDTPEVRDTLKSKLKQAMPEASEETINSHAEQAVSTAKQSMADADKHINAEAKANDLMQRGASKKEVEAVIKKNPLVGTKIEEIKAKREAMVSPGDREVPSDMLRPQRELQARAEKKAGEVESAWQQREGAPISKEEAFQKAEADRAEQDRLAAIRRGLFEEEAAGKVQEPPQRGVPKGFRQAGTVDKRLLAAMGGGAVAALAYPLLSKEHRQDVMLAGVLGMMGATDIRAAIKPMGKHLSGVEMTPAFKEFVKSGAFQEHFDDFAKDTGLPWHQKPDFKIHEGNLTFHPQDAGVVKSFIQYLSEEPYSPHGDRASIPPKLRQGVAPEHIEVTAPPITLDDFHGVFTKEAIAKAKEGHTVMMSPEDFNKLAYPRERTYRDRTPEQIHALGEEKRVPIRKALESGKGLSDIPSLDVENGKVVGHDGRHRADVLMEQGYDKIPVRIKGKAPAEGMSLKSETGEASVQLPPRVMKGQAGQADIQLLATMGLTAGGALTGYLLAGKNQMDKPAGAILGAFLGFGVTKVPTFFKALGENWKKTLASTAATGMMVGAGTYLDEQDPLEGALVGSAFAASRNMPKANKLSEEEFITSYNDGLMAHERIVHNLKQHIKTMIPDEQVRKDLYEKMHRGDFRNMTANEREVADAWKDIQKQYGEMAKNEGVIKGFIEDYVPRVASQTNLSASEVQRILSELIPERTNVSGSTKTKFAKSRTQETFDDFLKAAKAKGLDVSNVDFADVMANYMKSMNKAVQSARLIKTLENVKGSDGKVVGYIRSAEDAPRDYRTVSNPQLRGKRVHPELADALEIVMGGKSHHDITNAMLSLNSAAKRINVVGSFFHAKSLLEANLLSGKNVLDINGIRSALKMYHEGGAGDTVDKLIKSGLSIAVPDDAPIGSFTKFGELLDQGLQKSLGVKIEPFKKTFSVAEKAQMATFDRVTWDFLHSGLKLSHALKELEAYRTGKKYQGMSEQEAMKGISSAMNDTYGGINWARAHQEAQTVVGRKLMSLISTPNGRDMVGLLMFAPDWTMSTLRMFSKALPGGAENPANAALARKYVMNSAIAYAIGLNAINYMTSGHSIFDNKKSKTKIDLNDGTYMQLMKHAMEPYEAVSEPVKFVSNKLGTPAKLVSLGLTGSTSFSGKYPVDSRIGTALSLVAPFSTTSLIEGGMPVEDALLRGAVGTLGVGVYGTSDAIKRSAEYRKKQMERRLRQQRKQQ